MSGTATTPGSGPAGSPLRRRPIAGTGVELTEIGFGGAVIGNLYTAIDDDTAAAAVHAAWDRGVRYFDTAPHYGLGLSERRLGAALHGMPRADYILSSKVGRLLVTNDRPHGHDDQGFAVDDGLTRVRDYSRDGVLRSIEASLRRLQVDRLDVVFVHDPDDHWTQAADEAIPALAQLRDEKVIGAIGAGMNQSAMLTRFLTETATDVVMLAGRYTLLEQGALDDVLHAATRLGKSVIAAGVFNSGLLSRDRVAADAHYNYEPAPPELIDRANRIADICEAAGTTLPAAAVAFPLAHPSVVNVTLGMRTADQVRRNLDLHRAGAPGGVWPALIAQGLIRPDSAFP